MKPTPEQVEAAKAWMKDSCSVQQYRVIREYKPMLESLGDVSDNVSLILLAALEAAEADGARLDWLHGTLGRVDVEADDGDGPIPPEWSVRSMAGFGRGGSIRDAIDDARRDQP